MDKNLDFYVNEINEKQKKAKERKQKLDAIHQASFEKLHKKKILKDNEPEQKEEPKKLTKKKDTLKTEAEKANRNKVFEKIEKDISNQFFT